MSAAMGGRYGWRWFAALGLAIGVWVALGHESNPARRFDAPEAADHFYRGRREPVGQRLDTASLYAAALRRVGNLGGFSSRIGRALPRGANQATAVLDSWTRLGPGNIGGRTRVIRYHPTQHHVLFAAGVSGGIWKSDDNAITWRPIATGLANIAVNSLAIDPREPEVMFAGTGEGYFRRRDSRHGLAAARRRDLPDVVTAAPPGNALPATSSPDFHWVNDLELGVGDSRYVYAATRTGVWRSIDRGDTWTRLLATAVRGGCLDLAMRPIRRTIALRVVRIVRTGVGVPHRHGPTPIRRSTSSSTSLAWAGRRWRLRRRTPTSSTHSPRATTMDPAGCTDRACSPSTDPTRGGARGTWEARVTNSDPRATEHAAAHQHLGRDGSGLQHQSERAQHLHQHGMVREHHRGRPARSRARVGRRRRLAAIGRWRAQLGPRRVGRGAGHAWASGRARRSARHRVSPGVRRLSPTRR